jgi:membrane protease YdiL (CAAX protease family)
VDQLEERLKKHWPSLVAVVVTKFGIATAGIVLLVLAASRRRAERAGLIPRPLRRGAPTPATDLPTAFVILLGTVGATAGFSTLLGQVAPGVPGLVRSVLGAGVPGVAAGVLFLVLRRRALAARPWAAVAGPDRLAAVFGDDDERGAPSGPALAAPADEAVQSALWTLCVASAVGFGVGIAWAVLLQALDLPQVPQELVLRSFEGPLSDLVLISLFGILVAPFTEECFFRGFLYGSLRTHVGRPIAIAGVSALFAAVHGSWAAAGPLFVLACFLAWLYERTNSILATTVCHALFNASQLLPVLVMRLL